MSEAADGIAVRAGRGARWVTALRFGQRGYGLIRLYVVALYLTPEQAGIAAAALVIFELLSAMTAPGLYAAIIQSKEEPGLRMNAAWTVMFCRGLVLALAMAVLAPWIAPLVGVPDAVSAIRAMALACVLNGVATGGMALLRRDVRFTGLSVARFVAATADLVVTIGVAWLTHSYWAIIAGPIVHALFMCVSTYVLHPYRPRLDFGWGRLVPLLPVAIPTALSHHMVGLSRHASELLVGNFSGAAALGVYRPSSRLANLVATESSDIAVTVGFPALARLADDGAERRRVFLRMLRATLLLNVVFAGALSIGGPPGVRWLLSEPWHGMAALLPVLAFQGLFGSMLESARPMLYASGEAWKFGLTKLGQLVVLVALAIYFAPRHGPLGVAWSALISTAVMTPPCPVGRVACCKRAPEIGMMEATEGVGLCVYLRSRR